MPDRAAIRDWVREQTLQEVDDLNDTKINNMLDQAVRDTSSRFHWPFLQTSTTITTVAATQTYAMPADHVHTFSITDQDRKVRLREVSKADIWQRYGSDFPDGQPRGFFVWGDTIYMVPVPDTVITYDHYYYKQPTVMANDTDTPEWDSQFHLVIADFAIARIWEREEDFIKAESSMAAYLAGVDNMARRYLDEASDQPMILGERPERLSGLSAGNMPWLDGV